MQIIRLPFPKLQMERTLRVLHTQREFHRQELRVALEKLHLLLHLTLLLHFTISAQITQGWEAPQIFLEHPVVQVTPFHQK